MKNVILYEKGDWVFIYMNNVNDDEYCGLTIVTETPLKEDYNFEKNEVFLKTEKNERGLWVQCRPANVK